MKRRLALLLSALVLSGGWPRWALVEGRSAAGASAQEAPPPASGAGAATPEDESWQLVWADEFDVDGLPSPERWAYDVGGHGWGNRELQYYTEGRPENARVEDGHLILEARRDHWRDHEYTSARLVTRDLAEWRYGRIEVRARLPRGRGTWPAIWMLPSGFEVGKGVWPDEGEIDIMEHVGHDEGNVHGAVHCKKYNHGLGNHRNAAVEVPDATGAFHDYVLQWYPDRIEVLVDDTLYFTYRNEGTGQEAWPFDRAFYLVLNLAIGGSWGGAQGVEPGAFPQRLVVDFVRVYESVSTRTVPASGSAGEIGRRGRGGR